MSNKIEKMIALELIKAQAASDAGKGIDRIEYPHLRRYKYLGYGYKTIAIRRAIDLINSSPDTIFRYWVTRDEDQNGYDSLISYFSFKYEKKRYQISFHTPLSQAESLMPFVGKGMKMHWNRKGSFYTAQVLCEMIQQL